MPDECPDCGCVDLKYHRAWAATETDPAEPAGWECLNCGAWIDDDPDYEYYREEFE